MPDRKLDDARAERIQELRRRREFAAGMGGPDNIARQHDAGRLTVRERIAAIADADSFREVGTLAGTADYDENLQLKSVVPATYVAGTARIDARPVAIGGEDFTVRSGTVTSAKRRGFVVFPNVDGFERSVELLGEVPVEEVLDPRETRPLLCEYIALADSRLPIGLGPRARAGVAP